MSHTSPAREDALDDGAGAVGIGPLDGDVGNEILRGVTSGGKEGSTRSRRIAVSELADGATSFAIGLDAGKSAMASTGE